MQKIIKFLLIKKIIVFFLICSFIGYEQRSNAQALPVANFVVNRAVGGVIEKMAIARGVAANDPIIAATFAGIGATTTGLNVATTVAGVAFAVAGVPVWMSIAASLGLVAFGYGIKVWLSDSVDKPEEAEIKVGSYYSENGIQIDMPVEKFPDYPGPGVLDSNSIQHWVKAAQQGAPIYKSSGCYSDQICFSYPAIPEIDALRYQWSIPYTDMVLVTQNLEEFGKWYVYIEYPDRIGPPSNWDLTFDFVSAEIITDSKNNSKIVLTYRETRAELPPDADEISRRDNPPYTRIVSRDLFGVIRGSAKQLKYRNLDDAADKVPQKINNAKISDETLARLINELWQRASMQPNYQGVPYSVGQPVTASDVQSWASLNPQYVPRVRDMIQPANFPGTPTVPISPKVIPVPRPQPQPQPLPRPLPRPAPRPDLPSLPDSDVEPNPRPNPNHGKDVNVVNTPDVNVVNRVKVDLGDDPGVDSLDLENTPTARDIFQPVIDSIKSLSDYRVPSHTSECPKPRFDLFGKTLVMTSHCDLLDSVKSTLFTVMAGVWVVIGVLIVLGA